MSNEKKENKEEILNLMDFVLVYAVKGDKEKFEKVKLQIPKFNFDFGIEVNKIGKNFEEFGNYLINLDQPIRGLDGPYFKWTFQIFGELVKKIDANNLLKNILKFESFSSIFVTGFSPGSFFITMAFNIAMSFFGKNRNSNINDNRIYNQIFASLQNINEKLNLLMRHGIALEMSINHKFEQCYGQIIKIGDLILEINKENFDFKYSKHIIKVNSLIKNRDCYSVIKFNEKADVRIGYFSILFQRLTNNSLNGRALSRLAISGKALNYRCENTLERFSLESIYFLPGFISGLLESLNIRHRSINFLLVNVELWQKMVSSLFTFIGKIKNSIEISKETFTKIRENIKLIDGTQLFLKSIREDENLYKSIFTSYDNTLKKFVRSIKSLLEQEFASRQYNTKFHDCRKFEYSLREILSFPEASAAKDILEEIDNHVYLLLLIVVCAFPENERNSMMQSILELSSSKLINENKKFKFKKFTQSDPGENRWYENKKYYIDVRISQDKYGIDFYMKVEFDHKRKKVKRRTPFGSWGHTIIDLGKYKTDFTKSNTEDFNYFLSNTSKKDKILKEILDNNYELSQLEETISNFKRSANFQCNSLQNGIEKEFLNQQFNGSFSNLPSIFVGKWSNTAEYYKPIDVCLRKNEENYSLIISGRGKNNFYGTIYDIGSRQSAAYNFPIINEISAKNGFSLPRKYTSLKKIFIESKNVLFLMVKADEGLYLYKLTDISSTELCNRYRITVTTDPVPENLVLENSILYLRKKDNKIAYCLLNQNNKKINGTTDINAPNPFDEQRLNQLKSQIVSKLNGITRQKWVKKTNIQRLSCQNGWDKESVYKTFCSISLESGGKTYIVVCGFNNKQIVHHYYDVDTNVVQEGTSFSLANTNIDLSLEKHYRTLRLVKIKEGNNEYPCFIFRGVDSIWFLRYNLRENRWFSFEQTNLMKDSEGFDKECCFGTFNAISNGQMIYVIGRSDEKLLIGRFNISLPTQNNTNRWELINLLKGNTVDPVFPSKTGWSQPKYYKTISSVFAVYERKPVLVVSARGANEVVIKILELETKKWYQFPNSIDWTDLNGCDKESCFETFRMFSIKKEDADSSTLIFSMRTNKGIDIRHVELTKFNLNLKFTPSIFINDQHWAIQQGWNCFDIAIDLGIQLNMQNSSAKQVRAKLVELILSKKREVNFRKLLVPELLHAAIIGNEKDVGCLPTSVWQLNNNQLRTLVNNHSMLEENNRGDLINCNNLLGMRENDRLNYSELERFFDAEENRRNQNQAHQIFLRMKRRCEQVSSALTNYLMREDVYETYITDYYGNKGWVAFQRTVTGDSKSTSTVDIIEKLLNISIIIYDLNEVTVLHEPLSNNQKLFEIVFVGNNHFKKKGIGNQNIFNSLFFPPISNIEEFKKYLSKQIRNGYKFSINYNNKKTELTIRFISRLNQVFGQTKILETLDSLGEKLIDILCEKDQSLIVQKRDDNTVIITGINNTNKVFIDRLLNEIKEYKPNENQCVIC